MIRFDQAIDDFQRARAQASLQKIGARLRGQPIDLLSFDDVAERLQVTGKAAGGQRRIPLTSIVCSVGRYNDFTRTFLPRLKSDAQRWASVKVAGAAGILPPIAVYQIGDAYFVLDGNHRVSIARQQGVTHIDAVITVVRTRVPMAPDDDPDTLIVKTEHARFLADTRLDAARPEADVRVSAAGQYAHLENLIEVHRYFLEEREERAVGDREAVTRWYDEAYLPVVEVIREQGILRYFPGRTEADFYVWIATHQAQLRNELGWQVAPEVAAANLMQTMPAPRKPWRQRMAAWLRNRFGKNQPSMAPQGSWARERVAGRYSGQLFADLLAPIQASGEHREALAQAVRLAQCESSRVFGLYVAEGEAAEGIAAPQLEAEVAAFYDYCRAAGVEGHLTQEEGPWLKTVCRRAPLADLVVVGAAARLALVKNGALAALLQESPRPLLLVPGTHRPIRRVLLFYDGSAQAREALFAATYMAEQWGVELVALTGETSDGQTHRRDVQAYMELHELEVPMETAEGEWQQAVTLAAERHQSDLVVMGCPPHGARAGGRAAEAAALAVLLRACDRPLLVCT